MDLIHVVEEAKLPAAEQQRNIRRCYMCGCERNASLGRSKPQLQAATLAKQGKTSASSRRGETYWERIEF